MKLSIAVEDDGKGDITISADEEGLDYLIEGFERVRDRGPGSAVEVETLNETIEEGEPTGVSMLFIEHEGE